MSSFWSYWISLITIFTIVASFWLLFGNRKERGNQETTGHVYDGIEEYNNPLPAWWLWMFVATLVFGIGYLIAYPGLGNFKGLLNWSQISEYENEVAEAAAKYEPLFDEYAAVPIEELIADNKAMRMGQRLFANNCSQCHGSDARGAFGFPNLADNDWLYGGTPTNIVQSIVAGRNGNMPAWGPMLSDEQSADVVQHVRSLSGLDEPNETGAQVFGMFCMACHGSDATGMQVLGAPNLTDDIWLYGNTAELIADAVENGLSGIMPAHNELLTESRIHLVAAYVYSLSADSEAIQIAAHRKSSANSPVATE